MRKFISTILIGVLIMTSFAVAAAAQPSSYVSYAQFGAVGDGVTCDFDAIIAAHAYANEQDLPVRGTPGATYRIGKSGRTAIIQTSTDWTDVNFIVDNYIVPIGLHGYNIFSVQSRYAGIDIDVSNINSLARGQESIGVTLPQHSLVIARNDNARIYIRRGANADQGRGMVDQFIVDENGNVDPETPIVWDFAEVTSLRAYPIDQTQLIITGGNFTTIEAQPGWQSPYFHRGINVLRSNVLIDGLTHAVIDVVSGEAPPNTGFLLISNAANVTVQNSIFTGRIRALHGSYDIQMRNVVNLLFDNVRQFNCIHDNAYWGIMGANEAKNVVFNNVSLSRFDFHTGLYNATVSNSEIGHASIAIIGGGTFLLENTTVTSHNLINFRSDFGSTWNGDVIVRNSTFVPTHNNAVILFSVLNDGFHDFGMQTYMPRNILIDGLMIYDGPGQRSFNFTPPFFHIGPTIFSANHPYGNDALYVTLLWDTFRNYWLRRPPYAMQPVQSIRLRNIETESGRSLRTSKNIWRFSSTSVTRLPDSCPCER
ncbi:MAG: hypothetical protein FWD06_01215 [Oscillospiraceae bacterium]|nr:hypothetical protein [Oscillospiraceae bacterium]